MKIRKALLVLGMALAMTGATAGFAALTAADASGFWWWYDHDEKENPFPNTPKTVAPKGELSIILGGNTFGPCDNFIVDGELYNDPMGMGEGTFLKSVFDGEKCATSLPGCTVDASTFIGFPWEITLESGSEVTISNIEVETHLSDACTKYGVPLTSIATGTVKGEFSAWVPEEGEEEEIEATFVFDEVSGLSIKGNPATLDGSIAFGTRLTTEFIEL
jgi:hypothetical protein